MPTLLLLTTSRRCLYVMLLFTEIRALLAVTNRSQTLLKTSYFSTSIHCREAATKARRVLFMIRRPFAELSVSKFTLLYNTPIRPHLARAVQACSPNRVFKINSAVGDVGKWYPPPPIQKKDYKGTPKTVPHPQRYHRCIQNAH